MIRVRCPAGHKCHTHELEELLDGSEHVSELVDRGAVFFQLDGIAKARTLRRLIRARVDLERPAVIFVFRN